MHELFDHSSVMQTEFNEEVKQETCVTVTLMKAFYQALCLTGEAKYADAMERAGYNAMLGSINFGKSAALPTDGAASKRYGYEEALPFVQLIGGYTFDAYSPLYKDNRNRRVGGFRVFFCRLHADGFLLRCLRIAGFFLRRVGSKRLCAAFFPGKNDRIIDRQRHFRRIVRPRFPLKLSVHPRAFQHGLLRDAHGALIQITRPKDKFDQIPDREFNFFTHT
jgi:hypothetical protein